MVFVLGVDTPYNVSHWATCPLQRPPSQSRRGDCVYDSIAVAVGVLLVDVWRMLHRNHAAAVAVPGTKFTRFVSVCYFVYWARRSGSVFCFFVCWAVGVSEWVMVPSRRYHQHHDHFSWPLIFALLVSLVEHSFFRSHLASVVREIEVVW